MIVFSQLSIIFYLFFFELYGNHRDLHGLTHSFPTRRSSDLGPTASKIGATAARNASPGVGARIGPTSPSPSAIRLNAFPCPAGMPTAAWTSSCARMAA